MLRIFVSYCRENEDFVRDLRKFLRPYEDHQQVTIWMDDQIKLGAVWAQSIDGALGSCNVALLFVSQEFLNSSFVASVEVPTLLRRSLVDKVSIVPIFVSTSTVDVTKFDVAGHQGSAGGRTLADFQGFAPHNTPTRTLEHVRDKEGQSGYRDVLLAIANEISKIDPLGAVRTADPYPRETVTIPRPFKSNSGICLVALPGGTFTMGSPSAEEGRDNDEGPQRQVTVGPFAMGTYEVTQREYEAVIHNRPIRFNPANWPANGVSWFDAIWFCNALSEREGLPHAYTIHETDVKWDRSSSGYRLPTEAEWEYAARSGTTSVYFFGNDPKRLDGYARRDKYDPAITAACPVGKKAPSPWGLYDMYGNVREWCWDWYADPYDPAKVEDPDGPSTGTMRVLRGGSFVDEPRHLRSANRDGVEPKHVEKIIGFRICRSNP